MMNPTKLCRRAVVTSACLRILPHLMLIAAAAAAVAAAAAASGSVTKARAERFSFLSSSFFLATSASVGDCE